MLNHARWLGCREHRDHIYVFLGHPLAQLGDGSGTIVTPDYLEKEQDVFLELAVRLIQQFLNEGLWTTFGQMYRTPGQLPHTLGKID